jgi:hypothetical protein
MDKEKFKKAWNKVKAEQRFIVLDNNTEIFSNEYYFTCFDIEKVSFKLFDYLVCICELSSIKEVR